MRRIDWASVRAEGGCVTSRARIDTAGLAAAGMVPSIVCPIQAARRGCIVVYSALIYAIHSTFQLPRQLRTQLEFKRCSFTP